MTPILTTTICLKNSFESTSQALDNKYYFWYDVFERQVIDMIIWLGSGISVVHFLSDAVGR